MTKSIAKVPVTVIVPTLNEEQNLTGCLESVANWADEIVVIDAGSSDDTLRIASTYTSKVYVHDFGPHQYVRQKNWALTELPVLHEWILLLDADERVTPSLNSSISKTLSTSIPDDVAGFTINVRLVFLGRPIRYGAYAPNWALRLFHKDRVRFVDVGGLEYAKPEGLTRSIPGLIMHCDSKDLAAWTSKQNDRSTLEANAIYSYANSLKVENKLSLGVERRGNIKAGMWTKLPLLWRSLLLFLYGYLFRFGFLDGKEGFIYSFLMSFWYRLLVDAKYIELKLRGHS